MDLHTAIIEWDEDIIQAGLDLVSSYIARPGAGLSLRDLTVSLHDDCGLDLGPLARALQNGGAPNLKKLTLFNLSATGVRQLGQIYRGGGLSKLTELHLEYAEFSQAAMGAFCDGVLAADHKGSALTTFNVCDPDQRTKCREVSHAFIDGLAAGCFPNLVNFRSYSSSNGHFMLGNDVLEASIRAMEEGAPCARTLLYLHLPELLPKHFDDLKRALPNTLVEGEKILSEGECYARS
jgi:hypothetical protein